MNLSEKHRNLYEIYRFFRKFKEIFRKCIEFYRICMFFGGDCHATFGCQDVRQMSAYVEISEIVRKKPERYGER